MAALQQQEVFRSDVIHRLREMAAQGEDLSEMVQHVQDELGCSGGMMVPVLGYFCQAFSLPLPTVLPLREWPENKDDPEIAPLLSHLDSLAQGTGNGQGRQ